MSSPQLIFDLPNAVFKKLDGEKKGTAVATPRLRARMRAASPPKQKGTTEVMPLNTESNRHSPQTASV
jgi:hypothetical protein